MANETENEIKSAPAHVAIIMDGNGRWAKKRHLPRTAGHVQGAKVADALAEEAWDLGIKYLTIYAFSTENWKRSENEITTLMGLLRKYMISSIDRSMKNNVRVRVIGDKTRLAPDLQDAIKKLEDTTAGNTGLNFQIAINYGGRDELVRAVKNIAKEVKAGELDPLQIDEDVINSHLDTADIPYPDLLIRTSGEYRTSNFLPWQIAYSEFYFTDVLWPDFNKEELAKAVEYYNSRDRRFGGVK